jgi:hypothetical protein
LKTRNYDDPKQPPPPLQLLVMVPHRDTRRQFHAYSAALFASGLHGAWSFPWVVPLAALNRPLIATELKALARSLREHIDRSGGKCITGQPVSIALPAISGSTPPSIFGPSLNIELPDNFFEAVNDAVLYRLSPLVIGTALIQTDCHEKPLPDPPQISFRAAALATMSLRPLPDCGWDSYSFEWSIGTLHWLPGRASHRGAVAHPLTPTTLKP